ncbi:hypothetical protein [Streptomyces albireticuli]|uniref:Uncharacterized protein n=1 Tax=Streptomyces albireticuli TaxID=1940 RepID=A0A2A2D6N4_9ACTN|nr:hypothetical protein [Streptomyces albireticuli]MCD9141212.1 hypothetical protein [Streptomyces albireticuli]MCD9160827.1 hypothetical protein [Streptomyces albireticuli]MCD9191116.1 hypothetical protein [Streptomyces albireticuli]PAU47097.1 hypothetical protein CK936_20560 [Streptomyces albireticuli]
MAVSISVVLLLLILAVVFLRNGLKASHALVCVLLGFFLASTSVAPTIYDGISATTRIVGGVRP